MSKNKPIRDKHVRRTPDVRGQIQAATKLRETQMGEEVQTFKELYDEVKNDFDQNPDLRGDVKSNFVFKTSQGVILALTIACFASAADKMGYGFMDYISNRFENDQNTLEIDINDPISIKKANFC
jgi:Neuraminidase (sialidase)